MQLRLVARAVGSGMVGVGNLGLVVKLAVLSFSSLSFSSLDLTFFLPTWRTGGKRMDLSMIVGGGKEN